MKPSFSPQEYRYVLYTPSGFVYIPLTLEQISNGLANPAVLTALYGPNEIVSCDLWTGAYDSFNNKIYENDLVEVTYNREITSSPSFTGWVNWIHGTRIEMVIVRKSGGSYSIGFSGSAVSYRKVVGTIHKNPEIWGEEPDL